MRIRAAIGVAAIASALAGAASTQAAVTIGPDLASLTPNFSGFNCNNAQQCTVMTGSVGAGFGSGAVTSPVAGSITHVRIRTGANGAGPITLRLIHIGPAGYTGGASLRTVPALPANAITDVTGSFPIQAGDAIGVTCCRAGADNITSTSIPGSGSLLTWGVGSNPPLGVGETRAPDSTSHNFMVMLNADIEPTAVFTLSKAKVKGSKIKTTANVPNPGVLAAGGKLVRRTSVNASSAGPVALAIKLTKAGRSRLSRTGRLKLAITYTPSFGTATSSKLTAKG
jgi:hypothetical protein